MYEIGLSTRQPIRSPASSFQAYNIIPTALRIHSVASFWLFFLNNMRVFSYLLAGQYKTWWLIVKEGLHSQLESQSTLQDHLEVNIKASVYDCCCFACCLNMPLLPVSINTRKHRGYNVTYRRSLLNWRVIRRCVVGIYRGRYGYIQFIPWQWLCDQCVAACTCIVDWTHIMSPILWCGGM